MLCYAMWWYAMLYYAMLCCIMLCHAMICYIMLCYAIFYWSRILELYHTPCQQCLSSSHPVSPYQCPTRRMSRRLFAGKTCFRDTRHMWMYRNLHRYQVLDLAGASKILLIDLCVILLMPYDERMNKNVHSNTCIRVGWTLESACKVHLLTEARKFSWCGLYCSYNMILLFFHAIWSRMCLE